MCPRLLHFEQSRKSKPPVPNSHLGHQPERVSQQGWSSRVHVYAANHYAPYYDSYGNNNLNPDFQLDGSY